MFEEDKNSLELVTVSFYEPVDFIGVCDPTSCNTDEEICELNLNA